MKRYTSHSLEETGSIAKEWLASIVTTALSPRAEATIVGMSGHLGAGKTAFVKKVAGLLGVEEEVTSPTFVLMKVYGLDSNNRASIYNDPRPWKRLVHIDAYRLERPEELEALDFERLVSDPDNLIMVEWPENVGIQKLPGTRMLAFGIQGADFVVEIRD